MGDDDQPAYRQPEPPEEGRFAELRRVLAEAAERADRRRGTADRP